MSKNKENKKGFWSKLFTPKNKSVRCCGSQTDIVAEKIKMADTPSCGCESAEKCVKTIKVLGTGCSSCNALYVNVQKVVEQSGINATVEKEENLEKIMSYNVMSLPALVVDGKVVSKGQKLNVEQIKNLIL